MQELRLKQLYKRKIELQGLMELQGKDTIIQRKLSRTIHQRGQEIHRKTMELIEAI